MITKWLEYRAYVSAYYIRYGSLKDVWTFCQWVKQASKFPNIKG